MKHLCHSKRLFVAAFAALAFASAANISRSRETLRGLVKWFHPHQEDPDLDRSLFFK